MSTYQTKIAEVPLLQHLDRKLRDILADILTDIGSVRVLDADEILYEKGAEEPVTGAVLMDGALQAEAEGHDPIEIQPPELVGEMQQFDPHGRRTATVRAKDEATVLEFRWHDFVTRVLENPAISQADQLAIKEAFQKYVGDRLNQLS